MMRDLSIHLSRHETVLGSFVELETYHGRLTEPMAIRLVVATMLHPYEQVGDILDVHDPDRDDPNGQHVQLAIHNPETTRCCDSE